MEPLPFPNTAGSPAAVLNTLYPILSFMSMIIFFALAAWRLKLVACRLLLGAWVLVHALIPPSRDQG